MRNSTGFRKACLLKVSDRKNSTTKYNTEYWIKGNLEEWKGIHKNSTKFRRIQGNSEIATGI